MFSDNGRVFGTDIDSDDVPTPQGDGDVDPGDTDAGGSGGQ